MIYLVEDDPSIRKLVSYAIKGAGYEVEPFESGEDMEARAGKEKPELFLLDIMLPGKSGLELLSEIRSDAVLRDVPVIMLTAKGTEYDKVLGLDSGADDYIAKPFGMMELLSRIKAVLRRAERQRQRSELVFGGISISPSSHTVRVNGAKAELTLKEFNLLLYLMENEGIVLDRDSILNTVWGYSFDGENRTVDVHIRHLREKLGDEGQRIETVKGVGYRFRGHDE